jgi:hypothetical protein
MQSTSPAHRRRRGVYRVREHAVPAAKRVVTLRIPVVQAELHAGEPGLPKLHSSGLGEPDARGRDPALAALARVSDHGQQIVELAQRLAADEHDVVHPGALQPRHDGAERVHVQRVLVVERVPRRAVRAPERTAVRRGHERDLQVAKRRASLGEGPQFGLEAAVEQARRPARRVERDAELSRDHRGLLEVADPVDEPSRAGDSQQRLSARRWPAERSLGDTRGVAREARSGGL